MGRHYIKKRYIKPLSSAKQGYQLAEGAAQQVALSHAPPADDDGPSFAAVID